MPEVSFRLLFKQFPPPVCNLHSFCCKLFVRILRPTGVIKQHTRSFGYPKRIRHKSKATMFVPLFPMFPLGFSLLDKLLTHEGFLRPACLLLLKLFSLARGVFGCFTTHEQINTETNYLCLFHLALKSNKTFIKIKYLITMSNNCICYHELGRCLL